MSVEERERSDGASRTPLNIHLVHPHTGFVGLKGRRCFEDGVFESKLSPQVVVEESLVLV